MKNESGFLLIDLMVVVAISAIIATGAGMTTAQILQVTRSSEDHVTTARQAQNLGSWISQDLQMAMSTNTTDDLATPETEFTNFQWKDWETGATYDARYSWVSPTGEQKKVLRKLTVRDETGALVKTLSTLVADNIYSANVSLPGSGPKTLSVHTISGKKVADRQYAISTRPE